VAVLHFAQASDTSGFFPQLARRHDRTRYRMLFGTLNPMEPGLRAYMESQGVTAFSCESTRAQYPAALLRLTRFLRRQRVDVLHTHLFEPSVIGLLAGRLAGTPLRLMTRHYSDYHTRIHKRWHVRLDRLCTAICHEVIAVSRHTAEHLVKVEGAPPRKVQVILNGIDFERATPSEGARARVREELGVGEADLVLMVARLHPEKGHEYLFQALPEMRRRAHRPFRVLLAGAGPFESAYRARVQELGCGDLVRFLGFRTDIPDLMSAADILVLPSMAEAFGLVLAEALYVGVPVVATRVGGIPEIVADGVDGLLVPSADAAALAGAIIALLNDPAKRAALAGRGRTKVEQEFSFERMVRAYEDLYGRHVPRRE